MGEGVEKMHARILSEAAKRKRYVEETSALRVGLNTYLYRTPKGDFFVVHQTCWQGEQERLGPLPLDEAIELFRSLTGREGSSEDGFPGVEMWK